MSVVQPHRTPTCPTCGVQWRQAGDRTGHCSGCHRTFSGVAAFDDHQRDLACHDPAERTTKAGEPRWRTFTDECGAIIWRSAAEMPDGAFDKAVA